MPRWLYFLLIFTVLSVLLDFFHVSALVLFIITGLGILPLAALIGTSVEQIAEHTGERIGGLLFATFGNATELIIGILALHQGLISVVRASIIGSILGNALLVLGVAVCVGGFKHGRLDFETRPANQYSSLLILCIAGLLLPTVAQLLAASSQQSNIAIHVDVLSNFIAVLLLLGYIASILFSVFHVGDRIDEGELEPIVGARSESAITRLLAGRHHLKKSNVPPLWRALLLLTAATIGVAILSEILVGSLEQFTAVLHWNAAFVGLVFVPLIGGLPEYFNTIKMALDKRMGMVLAASAGSSIQIALLMTPILVLVSFVMPKHLNLNFSIVELVVLVLATFLFAEITKDGELVWLEGLLLILLYAMMGGTVFLFGS